MNFDTLTSIGDPEEVEVMGAERTTFYPTVEEAAKTLGLTIRSERRSEAGFCYRSDRFNLARIGIPSFSISEGSKFKGHDEGWGEAKEHDYLEHRYHQPADQFLSGMDLTGDTKLATFGCERGAQAAPQVKLVGWLPGDEFDECASKASLGSERHLHRVRRSSRTSRTTPAFAAPTIWDNPSAQLLSPQPRGNCLVSPFHKLFRTDPKPFSARRGGPVLFFLLFRVSRLCLLANFRLLLWCQHLEQLTDFEALVPLEHRLFRLGS